MSKRILLLILLCSFMVCKVSANDFSKQLSAEQIKSDLRQLYTDLKASHINLFENVTKQEYDAQFKALIESVSTSKSRLQAHILFQKFIAFGRVAHANIGFPEEAYSHFRDNGGKAFPIYVDIDESIWRIAENYSGLNLPAKGKLTHINDLPTQAWFKKFQSYISADTPAIAASLLEFKLPQYLWLVAQEGKDIPSHYKVTISNGQSSQNYVIESLNRDELHFQIDASAKPSDIKSSLREFRMLTANTAYLKPGPFYNAENPNDLWETSSFVAFIDDAFTTSIEKNASKMVIDVRSNPGGTNAFSDPLIAWYADTKFKFASEFIIRSSVHAEASNAKRLIKDSGDENSVSHQLAKSYQEHPYGSTFSFVVDEVEPREGKQFAGEIYVLIDRSSFSNAVSLAAITKDYGFGTIIGEATTDFATTLASMEHFTLNESGIQVGFPKARIVRPSGDKALSPVKPDIELESFELSHIAEILNR